MTTYYKAMSIADFCQYFGICRTSFHNMQQRGEAPRTLKVGRRVIITPGALAEWERARLGEVA